MSIETNGTPVIMNGGDGMFGGNGMGFWGFLILAMFLFGGSGFGGWGNNGFANAIGYENLATSNEVQRGFDNQNQMANQREILSAVNDASARGIAATNQSFHDTLNAISDKYEELQRDNAELRVGQANLLAKQNECCCNTLRAIDGVNYSNALNTASIKETIVAEAQKNRDMFMQSRYEDVRNENNFLRTQNLLGNVVRYPTTMAYNAGTSPFCNCGNGCGYGYSA